MSRFLILLAATAMAAPAAAGTYTARTAAPVSDGKIIARDIVWNCAAGACKGSTLESRPQVLCQSLAKRAGRLSSFAVDGRAFASGDLDKCNSVAPAPRQQALAEAN